ncbi:hypothetical protein FHR33_006035 [Nonomuraea dietziae]|uniref:Uncharacterized protein n=1 Tax=Nonomuraea dietziae TaxID=65515 RepID=A0A7W5VAP0_9ACTN|nr:hypothetical protein [Nonomuraea dietziae]
MPLRVSAIAPTRPLHSHLRRSLTRASSDPHLQRPAPRALALRAVVTAHAEGSPSRAVGHCPQRHLTFLANDDSRRKPPSSAITLYETLSPAALFRSRQQTSQHPSPPPDRPPTRRRPPAHQRTCPTPRPASPAHRPLGGDLQPISAPAAVPREPGPPDRSPLSLGQQLPTRQRTGWHPRPPTRRRPPAHQRTGRRTVGPRPSAPVASLTREAITNPVSGPAGTQDLSRSPSHAGAISRPSAHQPYPQGPGPPRRSPLDASVDH